MSVYMLAKCQNQKWQGCFPKVFLKLGSQNHKSTLEDPRFLKTFGEESWILRRSYCNIESILNFNMPDPRSKIPQDSWGRILDSAKAILKYLIHIEVQYGGSKIQDSSTRVLENLGSWILDPPY